MNSVFRSLAIRNNRSFLAGQLVSIAGVWIQRVAQAWLVLDLTHGSGTALVIASGIQFLPLLLFGMWGGLIAERYPKRLVITATQAALGPLALGLGVQALAGVAKVWHVYAFAFCLRVVTAIDKPTRQAFVIDPRCRLRRRDLVCGHSDFVRPGSRRARPDPFCRTLGGGTRYPGASPSTTGPALPHRSPGPDADSRHRLSHVDICDELAGDVGAHGQISLQHRPERFRHASQCHGCRLRT